MTASPVRLCRRADGPGFVVRERSHGTRLGVIWSARAHGHHKATWLWRSCSAPPQSGQAQRRDAAVTAMLKAIGAAA